MAPCLEGCEPDPLSALSRTVETVFGPFMCSVRDAVESSAVAGELPSPVPARPIACSTSVLQDRLVRRERWGADDAKSQACVSFERSPLCPSCRKWWEERSGPIGWSCSLVLDGAGVDHRIMFSLLRSRSRDRRRGVPQPHPFFSAAVTKLPSHTRWAVACNAEFRADGVGDLRGILHHDGAILRFTTWGGAERFAGAPMEFTWEMTADGILHIVDRHQHSWFLQLQPLCNLVPEPPAYAPSGGALEDELQSWMRTWAPGRSTPLASHG